jgi:ketosteroid isomerase-like protein
VPGFIVPPLLPANVRIVAFVQEGEAAPSNPPGFLWCCEEFADEIELNGGSMTRAALMYVVVAMTLSAASCSGGRGETITQDELVRRTQEFLDAVAIGDRKPFEKYFADDSMIFDERGRSMDKKALIADQSPLPAGYSGTIKVVSPQSRILGDTAILSYDLDETETIFGQEMKARYHETDTWARRNGEWQIVAEQVLRYYEDPAPGKPDLKKYPDYVGTYDLAPGTALTISAERSDLFSQRTGRAKDLLIPEAPDIFFVKGVEGRRLFRRDDRGRVDALIDRRNNEDVVWRKTK